MPDLRLALPAIALWVACAVLIGVTDVAAAVAAAAGVGAVGAATWAAIGARERSRAGRFPLLFPLLAVVLAAIALGSAAVAVAAPGRVDAALDGAARESDTIEVNVRVERTPHRMAAGFGAMPRWTLRGRTVGEPAAIPVALQFDAEVATARTFAVGTVVRADGTPVPEDPGKAVSYTLRLAGEDAPAIVEPPPPWLAWTSAARSAFAEAAGASPGDGGALLPGLAIGDETSLPPRLDEAMTTSSLSHLTAVSGANCALVIGLVFLLARATGLGRRTRIAVAGVALLAFVALVGPGPSVIRAAAMAGVLLIGLARGRAADGIPALSLAMVVLLIHDPWLARDYGFALSVLATAGLLLLAGPLSRTLARWMPRSLALAVAVPTAAQLACQPVLVLLSPTLPLFGIPANLLAEPAAPIATVLGCLACAVLPWAPGAGELIVRLAWAPSAWIAQVATFTSGLPGVALPWAPGILGVVLSAAVLAAVAVLVLARGAPRIVSMAAAFALCAGALVYVGAWGGGAISRVLAIPAEWQVAACDVGQGDGILLRDGDAVAMIDVGREPEPAAACLDRLGIHALDVLILTHFDADHVGGVSGVASRARRAIVQRPVRASDERTLAVLAAAGVPVEQGHAGLSGQLGAVSWRLLWPPGEGVDIAAPEGMDSGNAGSLTVEAEGRGMRSIFLGDLGQDAQDALLATRAVRPVDVVKMAHHGSADQSPELYRALDAQLGLVSVGAHNGYGHPTASALRLLGECGTAAARTDQQGILLVSPGMSGLQLWSERSPEGNDSGRPYPGKAESGIVRTAEERGDTWRPEVVAEAERARRAPPRVPSHRCRGARSAPLRSCSSRGPRVFSPIGRCAPSATPSRRTIPASRSATSTRATMRPESCSRSRAPPCSGSRG